MSFICGLCGRPQPAGIKPVMVVTKVRELEGRAKMINDTTADYIQPWQIVEEKMACPVCAKIPRIAEVTGKPFS